MSLIALLTDFGLTDHYAGSIKAAIAGINPKAVCIDITHAIAPGDMEEAAFTLLLCFHDFPRGTIFTVVVDPGVGSDRKAIAVKCGEYYFIGPDNGVLSLACESIGKKPSIRSIENQRLFRTPVSSTFHGRDIFGPVAAHLSKGIAFEKLGPVQRTLVRCRIPAPQRGSNGIKGIVAYIDHFGNCITTIDSSYLSNIAKRQCRVILKKKALSIVSHYGAVAPGEAAAMIGSAGYMEIAVNGGNAASVLHLKRGDAVNIVTAW